MSDSRLSERGFSILEVIASVAIFSLLIVGIGVFQLSIFDQNKNLETRSGMNQETVLLLRRFTEEIRNAQQSNAGSYAINKAEGNEFIFFSDTQGDGLVERIRYTLSANKIERGTITPTGNPLTYVPGNEKIQTIVTNVQGTNPLFTYYDSTYNSVTATDPLTEPISVVDVRHIKLEYVVDPQKNDVIPQTVSTQITIRNLREL